jgi:hypothetical protein
MPQIVEQTESSGSGREAVGPTAGTRSRSFRLDANETKSSERVVIFMPIDIARQRRARVMPTVDVATIGRVASGIVFIICMATFVIGLATGFYAIFPPMNLLVAGMAAIFYILSVLLARQWKR